MDKKRFEREMEQQMHDFRLRPAESVWQQVEQRIKKEKKRRFILWWMFPSLLILVYIFYTYLPKTLTDDTLPVLAPTVKNEIVMYNDTLPMETQQFKDSFSVFFVEEKFDNCGSVIKNPEEILSDDLAKKEDEVGFLPMAEIENDKRSLSERTVSSSAFHRKLDDTMIIVQCAENSIPSGALAAPQITDSLSRQLNFNAYYSFHGSGDLSGTLLEIGQERKIGKRYSFYTNLGVTIHSGQEIGSAGVSPLRLNYAYNALQSQTIGVQATPMLYRYSKRGDIKIGVGLAARYQMGSFNAYGASSISGSAQYQYSIYEAQPNSFSLGYRINVGLILLENRKNKLGLEIFFQNDTEGDVITGLGLSFQTKYKK